MIISVDSQKAFGKIQYSFLLRKTLIKLDMKGTNLSIGPFLWLGGKNYTYKAGDTGPIPGSGRSPGEGNGNSLQHSYLGNPIDRGDWRATLLRERDDSTTKQQK